MKNKYSFVTWSLALYFGWILSFPYFGAVLRAVPQSTEFTASQYIYAFLLLHALGYLACALLLKNYFSWSRLMLFSLSGTVFLNIMLWFSPAEAWIYGLALLGFISSFYVVGWSNYYRCLSSYEKVYVLVHLTIRANLIALAIMFLSTFYQGIFLLAALITPLLAAVYLIILVIKMKLEVIPLKESVYIPKHDFPAKHLLVICLFIAALKLSAGFMYSVMHYSYPSVGEHYPFFEYYAYFPYLVTYILILKTYHKLHKHTFAFAGASLLGISYITFALLGDSHSGFFITTIFIEAAFAMLNVFLWTLLGDLATVYGKAYRFFGFGLFANISSTLAGSIAGDYILWLGDYPRFITALYAAAAVIIALGILHWLKTTTEHLSALPTNDSFPISSFPLKYGLTELTGLEKLTRREKEVVTLLMKGYSSRKIADALVISENTLKTHLKNIYRKFGVQTKYELFAYLAKSYHLIENNTVFSSSKFDNF